MIVTIENPAIENIIETEERISAIAKLRFLQCFYWLAVITFLLFGIILYLMELPSKHCFLLSLTISFTYIPIKLRNTKFASYLLFYLNLIGALIMGSLFGGIHANTILWFPLFGILSYFMFDTIKESIAAAAVTILSSTVIFSSAEFIDLSIVSLTNEQFYILTIPSLACAIFSVMFPAKFGLTVKRTSNAVDARSTLATNSQERNANADDYKILRCNQKSPDVPVFES